MNLNYKELSERAFYYHTHKNLDKAEELYKQLLGIKPDDVNILNLLGLLYLSTGKHESAVEYLSEAFLILKNAYIASNLAKAYYMCSEPKKAIKIYSQALIYGENDDIYYSMALAYKKLNDYQNVIRCYKKAIELNPKNYNALYNLSLACKSIKDIKNAVFYAEKCAQLKQSDDIYSMLSAYYEDLGDIASSIKYLTEAVKYNNNNYLYFYNLAVLFSKLGEKDKAEVLYKKAIELNPNHAESYVNAAALYKGKNNEEALKYLLKACELKPYEENILLSLAQTYRDLYDNEKSINILKKILKKNPNSSNAYSQLASNYMDTGSYKKALTLYNTAIKLSPDNLNFLHGKAVALKYLGKINQAKKILEYVVSKDKSDVQSAITLGMMYLTDKEFEKGMKLYCLRTNESKFNDVFKNKIWNKNDETENKNILVYTDCGLGDTIMCSRFLNELQKKAKSVTLQTDKELAEILKNSFKLVNVIKKGETPPEYDFVISIMNLQYALNIDFDSVKSEPYIFADLEKEKKMSELNIIKNKKNKIGIFWQGNKRIFKNRSIDLNKFEKLISNKKYIFYSFQIDKDTIENENLISLKKYINDYSDTAAILKNIDILITIDSSIAHMAGALGVKTFLLLPYTAEWRWFNDTKSTVWYKSVKIFRQTEAGNWDEVIERVMSELDKL